MTEEPIYQDEILVHAKAPRHYGQPTAVASSRTGLNPLCGDEVTLYLSSGETPQVLQFVSKGCALCRASASLMTEQAMAHHRSAWGRLTPGAALLEVESSFPSRTRCVRLPWETFAQLLQDVAKESP